MNLNDQELTMTIEAVSNYRIHGISRKGLLFISNINIK